MNVSVSPRLVDLIASDGTPECNDLLRHQREVIQLTLDTLPDIVCIQDKSATIQLANVAFREKTGLPVGRIIGKEGSEFFITNKTPSETPGQRLVGNEGLFHEEEIMIDKVGQIRLLDTLKIPLFDSENIFQGVFSVSRDITDQKRIDDDREALISRLKDAVAVLEKQSKLLKSMNAQLQDLATTDELTKVGNRRFFDHRFGIEWRRCCREKAPLALMIFDIDYFKRFNDYYGHTQGDLCLTAVARALNEHTCRRPGDVFARFGGEEFVGLLPNTIEGLESLAEHCVRAVSDLGIAHVKSSVDDQVVTVSIGAVVGFPHLLDNSLDLLDLADQQLYLAKQSGRNAYEYFKPRSTDEEHSDDIERSGRGLSGGRHISQA